MSWRARCGLLALLFVNGIEAQPPTAIQEALKEYAPAGLACERAVSSVATVAPNVTPVAATGNIRSIGVAASARLIEAGAVVVDLRAPADYALAHIDGSLNYGIGDLKTKSFLRERPLVLVGSGKDERTIHAACTQLLAAGFRGVTVMRGGMLSWIVNGQLVVGSAPAPDQIARLSPMELFQEASTPDASILLFENAKSLQALLPKKAVVVRGGTEPMMRALRESARRPGNAVLIANRDLSQELFAQAVRAASPRPVLLYTGSAEEFSDYLAMQKAIALARDRGPPQPRCNQ